MDRSLASKRRARELATPIRNDFVYVHVELRSTSRHPHVQWKHVLVLSGQKFVASLDDESVSLVVEPLPGTVGLSGAFFQRRICCDHLPRDQIFSNTEVLERALRLRAPQAIPGDFDFP